MKMAKKWKITTASLIIGVLTQNVWANSEPIHCVASNHQVLTFQLMSEPDEYKSAVYSGLATDLHGIGVATRGLPVKILVTPILTRTVVGFSYRFNLPNGTPVALTHIAYASPSFEAQLGFKGQAKLTNGFVVGLQCQISNVQQSQDTLLESAPDEDESCPPGEHLDVTHHRIPTCVKN